MPKKEQATMMDMKLGGVGPIDNRSSTNLLHHFFQFFNDKKKKKAKKREENKI